MIRGRRIFIPGGSGFIGTALVGRLLEANEVVVFDNGHRDSLSSSPGARARPLEARQAGPLQGHRPPGRAGTAFVLQPDHPKHVPYLLGNLSAPGASIFDAYADEAATAWRRSLASVGAKDDPCRTCRQKTVEGEALIRLGERIQRRLDRIEVAL